MYKKFYKELQYQEVCTKQHGLFCFIANWENIVNYSNAAHISKMYVFQSSVIETTGAKKIVTDGEKICEGSTSARFSGLKSLAMIKNKFKIN